MMNGFRTASFSFGFPSSALPVLRAGSMRSFDVRRELEDIPLDEPVARRTSNGGGGFWDGLKQILLAGAAGATSLGLERLRRDWEVAPARGGRDYDYYDPGQGQARAFQTFPLATIAQYVPLALLIFGGVFVVKALREKKS
jgi:hypothetical protein